MTDKQVTANRMNAHKGGVKTQEGKAISRYNARTPFGWISLAKSLQKKKY